MLQLTSVRGSIPIHHSLVPPDTVTMGRSRDCDIVVAQPQISRQHAQLAWDAAERAWTLTDLGSRSGTSINGERIPPALPCVIRKGDRIGLPDVTIQVRDDHGSATMIDSARRIQVDNDAAQVDSIDFSPVEIAEDLDASRLASLLDFSRDIHDAGSPLELYNVILQGITTGTSLTNAAVVSCMDGDHAVEVEASVGELAVASTDRFSRTLLRSASEGTPGRFVAASGVGMAESLLRLSVQAACCAPLMTGDTTAALLYADTTDMGSKDDHLRRDLDFVIALAQFASIALTNLGRADLERRFAAARSSMFEGTVRALASAIDAKDPYTRGHSDRVSWLAGAIAEALGRDSAAVEAARVCGQVHDVGKIGVPEQVLVKPDRLDDAEFDLIKQHPDIGYRILKDIPAMKDLLGGVRHHHERWDGRGYPQGLAGTDIPDLGRLVAVADTFDAMRSARAYRPGQEPQRVLDEIRACRGQQFDPDMVDAFLTIDLAPYDAMLDEVSASGTGSDHSAR